ncbi:MAG TPA: hypothetical protein VFK13_04210 [Gemmatimonadaceae bacterium]|nr:hypothetical protein [Gemmatimonadaceae bacterium]
MRSLVFVWALGASLLTFGVAARLGWLRSRLWPSAIAILGIALVLLSIFMGFVHPVPDPGSIMSL